jgi:hypothetical protein
MIKRRTQPGMTDILAQPAPDIAAMDRCPTIGFDLRYVCASSG